MDPSVISSIVWDKGPTGVLAFAVVLILTGRLQWRKNLTEQIDLLAKSWEDRLKAGAAELERATLVFDKVLDAQESLMANLRDEKAILTTTLQGSVENTRNLLTQQDELLESARITAPILRALQEQVSPHDR